jgi:hypothetical protein
MTAGEPAARPASVGWVLRLGARAAFVTALPLLALGGVLAISRAAWSVLWPALFQADPALRLHGTLLASGLGLLVLGSVARAVVLAVAVQGGAARVRSSSTRPEISPARAGLRGIAWAAAAVVVDQILDMWFWGVLVASGVAVVAGDPLVSLTGVAGIALVLTLGLFLVPAASLWVELGLVVSVVRPARFAEAAGVALHTLGARPGAVVLLWVVTAVPARFFAAGILVLSAGAAGPGWASAAAAGVAVVLMALVEAVATLIRLDALAALVLDDQGELPRPPPAPAPAPRIPVAPLVSAAEVVEARPVGPMAPWTPGAPG